MKTFALTGVAGYIAPRHLKAIKDTCNNLIAAVDPHDSVGILDQYFPDCAYFREYERFDRHLEKLKREGEGKKIDFISICSPNHLHDAHIRTALRIGADAICEKPLVLNPWNLDILQELEHEYGRKVYTVLQLRVHPALIELKNKIALEKNKKHNVELTYITSRGLWYDFSWKGDVKKSGGVATNIGIHFFDLLYWLFGSVKNSEVYRIEYNKIGGFLELENANIKWYLSIDKNDLPQEAVVKNMRTFRFIQIDGNEIEFTDGFSDLHTQVYKNIISGNGFGVEHARPSLELVYNIRNAEVTKNPDKEKIHQLIK